MNKDRLRMALGRVVLSDDVKMGDAITGTMQMSVFVALEGGVSRELFMKVVEETWDLGVQAMDKIANETTMEA